MLLEGNLKVKRDDHTEGGSKEKFKTHYLFLFNDILLDTEPAHTYKDSLRIKHMFNLADSILRDVKTGTLPPNTSPPHSLFLS